MKHKNTILFHKDWQPLINSLPQDAQIEFWQLFMNYEPNNKPDVVNPIVVPIWTFIQSQLDKFNDNYEQNVVERNRLNGSKGGRPKKSQENPKNPMGYLETQKTLNKNKNINNNENKKIIEEVKTYTDFYGQTLINNFIEYWFTKEKPNHSKTRFEKQKTFDVKKRLNTWFKNTKDFPINNLNFYLSKDEDAKEVFDSLYRGKDYDKAIKWFADKKIKEGAIPDSYLNYKKHFFNSIKNI